MTIILLHIQKIKNKILKKFVNIMLQDSGFVE